MKAKEYKSIQKELLVFREVCMNGLLYLDGIDISTEDNNLKDELRTKHKSLVDSINVNKNLINYVFIF